MTLTVLRQLPVGDAVLGQLLVDGLVQCFTLERASTLTPNGLYLLRLTVSQRCADGILWSPDDDLTYRARCPWAKGQHRLLLVDDVPGRSGIRLHAANYTHELDGCTAVGTEHVESRLILSRPMLANVMNKIVPALNAGPVTIEYRQAQPQPAAHA